LLEKILADAGHSKLPIYCVDFTQKFNKMPKRSRSSSPSAMSQQLEESLRRLDDELRRSRCAYDMGKKLHALCEAAGIDSMSVFVGFVFETIAQRTVYERAFPGSSTRMWLHAAIDTNRGLEVRLKSDTTVTGTFDAVKFVAGSMLASVSTSNGVNEAHALDQWEPVEPIPLFLDSMLPSGEVVVPHRSPMSVFQLCLSKLCEADKNKTKSFNAKKRVAWNLSDQTARLAFEARRDFHSNVSQAVSRSISVVHQRDEASGEAEVLISLSGSETFDFETTHKLVEWQFNKLQRFYRIRHPIAAGSTEDYDAVFRVRLFTMLQRYTGVTGLFSRIEAGWHAAVPPEPFDYLRNVMGAEAEGFASPLNARMTKFCSAFHDTDEHFGSQGPFHRFFPRRGCFEVGPPYDHEVIRIAFAHAVECLKSPDCDGPLCFVFIIPDSTRDAGVFVRQLVENCIYKKISEVIPRLEAKYIDGFQHRPGENRLITISCDTRIIILQNDAAADKLPAAQHFAELRQRWVHCTATIDTSDS
jgi:phosphorylated CTD-interacting factor 1